MISHALQSTRTALKGLLMPRALTTPLLIAAILGQTVPASAAVYRIVARHSGKALNVESASTADAAPVVQWPYATGDAHAEWDVVDVGSGYHRITARHSGKSLNVEAASGSDGARVIQWPYGSGESNAQWQLVDAGGGYQRIVARHSGLSLTVAGASVANGAAIQQSTWANGNHQMWQLTPVTTTPGAEGPGLPKLSFTEGELFEPLSLILPTTPSGQRRGNGLTTMHKGWFATVYANDSGQSGGGFAFYDLSNPRSPQLVARKDVPSLREQHGFARSAPGAYPGDYIALQAGTGIEFWDWTDVRNPVLLNAMALPGVDFSDYDVGAWWLTWQAPFVYVGASGNGIFVVDATDPRNPSVVRRIPTSQTGGFRIHPIFAVGNLLVATSVDFNGPSTGIVTMDISDPRNPTVIRTQSTGLPVFYSSFFNGNKLIGLGNNDHSMYVWDLTNPAAFVKVGEMGGMDRPVYATVQDNFALIGDESSFVKVDIRTTPFRIVGRGTGGAGDRSEDIITPLGNLAFVANDHPAGSGILPHSTAPDNTGPSVNMVNPPNGATQQKATSRVGLTLTDWIDLRSVNNTTFVVRPLGGAALTGKYSGEQGILNFWPDQPLQAATTYEVVIPAGGLKDFSGNGVPAAFVSRFSTTGTPGGAPSVQVRANGPATVGTVLGFDVSSSSGGALTYSWDFGDGTPPTGFSSSSAASHAYSGPGHFAVKVTARNGNGQAASSYVQAIHHPTTPGRPASSGALAVDAARNRVWVCNPDADTVTAIDGNTHARLFERTVGRNPRTLARAPDGTIWVVNQDSATISVLSGDQGASVQTLVLPYGSQPFGISFAPNGSAGYVTTQGSGQVLKLDPATRTIVAALSLGFPLRGIAVSQGSGRIFVTRFVSGTSRGEVVEIGASPFQVVRTFALAFDPGPDGNITGRGVPNYLSSIAISPDGRQARVPSKKDNIARGEFRDGQALDFETTVRTIVSYLDLGANAEVLPLRVDLNDRDMASAAAYSPLGDYVFVATQGTNTVEVFDAYDNRLVTGIPDVGLAPQGLAFSADGRTLYVQSFMSRSIAVYDVSGIVSSTTNTFTKLADVDTVAAEKLPGAVLRGKQIFYNAADRRMNRDGYISCASCHLDGGHDGRVWDFTDRGEGLRNTPTLMGRRGTGHGNVHWTANFDEIQDFEHDMRSAFGGSGFLSDAQFNTGTRNTPLGDRKGGVNADLDALAAYVTSLNRVPPSPFRNANGSLTADGQAGRAIFERLLCASCHSGADFTDSATGVRHDVGTIKPSSGRRLGQPLTGIDTPTLKGLAQTAPYLHDGSAATLMDVLTTANPAGRHGNTASLTAAERQQLVAYLLQIDDAGSPPVETVVQLFQHCNHGGWAASFGAVGTYSRAQIVSAGGLDNDASSIKVASGFKATLFDGDGQTGSSIVLTADSPCFVAQGFNDVLSSMRVEAIATGGVVFFEHASYGGAASQPLAVGSYTLSQLQARGVPNDWASSVRIPSGRTVTLFEHDNFAGASWTLTGDTPGFSGLNPNANDQLSSVTIQ
jgi:DNA-binding beta-propeller fold protein YncE